MRGINLRPGSPLISSLPEKPENRRRALRLAEMKFRKANCKDRRNRTLTRGPGTGGVIRLHRGSGVDKSSRCRACFVFSRLFFRARFCKNGRQTRVESHRNAQTAAALKKAQVRKSIVSHRDPRADHRSRIPPPETIELRSSRRQRVRSPPARHCSFDVCPGKASSCRGEKQEAGVGVST